MNTATQTQTETQTFDRDAQFAEWRQAGNAGELKDDENPIYVFSTTWTTLLTKIASGEVDAQHIAKQTLADRGLDCNGQWVGFEKAYEAHFPKNF